MKPDTLEKLRLGVLGRRCILERREADWSLDFEGAAGFSIGSPWRILRGDAVALADADDGQQFGLPAPVDAEALANSILVGQIVERFEVDLKTADVVIGLTGNVQVEIWTNSLGYEGWQASLAGGNLSVIGLGGGGLAFIDR